MRFMMLMIPLGYETAPPDIQLDPERVRAMMKYNEALKDAGVLITLDGLHPPSMGARVSFATGSCKSLSHELAQGTTPRGSRLPPRQFERGAAAGGARADCRERRGRFHLRRCRAHGRRQSGGAVPAFSRPRRIAFEHRPARLRAIRGAPDQRLG